MVTTWVPVSRSRSIARRLPGTGRLRPNLIGELLVVLTLVKVYDAVRSLAAARESEALEHGRNVLSVETFLHIDIERTLNQALAGSRALTELTAGWYQFAHLTATLSVLACCYRWRPEIYRRARSALVVVNLVGLAVFWLYPCAPPRLLPGSGFVDAGVVAGYASGPVGPVSADMFAAMPSLHVAWAIWTVIVFRMLLRQYRWARWLAPLYAVVTSLVVVATANHYVLDVVAGAAVALLAVIGTGLAGRPPHRVPPATPESHPEPNHPEPNHPEQRLSAPNQPEPAPSDSRIDVLVDGQISR